VRAVVHAGEVASDAYGHAGKDLNLAFRLLDSDLLRGYLANARTSLVLLVSASIYNDIIEQGYREIDAEAFQPVQVAAKSTHALAWVYVPGRHNGVATGQQRPGLATAPTAPPAIPHELPADIPDFTGHEAKLKRLLAALTPAGSASPTVVAVHGVGGVGKSALAVTVMRQVAPHFAVVIWRSLRDAPTCDALVADCLQVLAPHALRDLPDALDARDGALDDLRHAALDDLVRGAAIDRRDRHDRAVHGRIFPHRQVHQRGEPADHQEEAHHDGEDGSADEEV
jgi:hypothetical protein